MPDNEKYIDLYCEIWQKERTIEESLLEMSTTTRSWVVNIKLMKKTQNLETFWKVFNNELKQGCLKFIPSFFTVVKSVCKNIEKAKEIETILLENLNQFINFGWLAIQLLKSE